MAEAARTITYRYGLLAPTAGAELVDQQIRLAHQYQNTLIEIERDRREAVFAVSTGHPDVAPQAERVETLSAELDELESTARSWRRSVRKRRLPDEVAEEMRRLRVTLREARQELREARREVQGLAPIQAAIAEANDQAAERRREARARSGVYWGAYLLAERAVDATRRHPRLPGFQRWSGEGAVAVQLQGGLSTTGALASADARLQIDLGPMPVPGRGGKPRPRVRLRVGSERRKPVWAEWPLIYHRELPPEGRVKWAKAVRRVIAGKEEWSLHLTVALPPTWVSERCGRGVVAVDLGWRKVDGKLRAGSYAASDRRTGVIVLEPEVAGDVDKASELRSLRDKELNAMRERLLPVLEGLPFDDEHREQAANIAQSRSPAEHAALCAWWREYRLAGEDEVYEILEAWRKRDKHLWLWETHARRGALARRRDAYGRLAADLARRYRTLVIERLNLSQLAAATRPGSARGGSRQERRQRELAAPSELRRVLIEAFENRGGRVVTAPPAKDAESLLEQYSDGAAVEEFERPRSDGPFRRRRAAAAEAHAGRRARTT